MSKVLPSRKLVRWGWGEDCPFPLEKQESDREVERELEWWWSESRKRKIAMCTKGRGPIHIYRVTDNTQIGQMSKDTRGTQFCGVVETLL